jgi:propionyl-CoA carboxylase alpha chain
VIERVLVANRGEIARRVFATCRRLGIATAAIFSEPDIEAPFVRDADVAVAVGGRTPSESYLRADAILEAAHRVAADAIHPGYGFLAENAAFAQAVVDRGLVWIGPTPKVIEAMGSKIEARSLMQAAGVPILPGRRIADEVGEDLAALASEVGFPLMAKASAGGGGKGMRLIASPNELEAGVQAARREAMNAFGDDELFLERYLSGARHIEVQIFGDTHGNIAALHERDCSIQRRHQKIIEEAPSPAMDPDWRQAMNEAAVAAGKILGYVGAGTVEFLATRGGEFYFLEVNTRLQVEHAVTELVTGLDLVELQLLVAEGQQLPPEALAPALNGHAIEARLYAEDPSNDFLPVTGRIVRFSVPAGVRVDTGVEDGSAVSPYYDPMIAKLVAHGRTRGEATRRLADALTRAKVQGLITNRDFLVRVLLHPTFSAGEADTSFLDGPVVTELATPLVDAEGESLAAAAVALAGQAARRETARTLHTSPSGWRNNPSQLQSAVFSGRHCSKLVVAYEFARDGSLEELRINETVVRDPVLHHCTRHEVDLEVAGVRRTYLVRDGVVNSDLGQVTLIERARFAIPEENSAVGSLVSPMPGTVIRVLADVGQSLSANQPVLILEAMKMEHELVSSAAGIVTELRVTEGEQVDAGVVLAVIEPTGDGS